MICALLYALSSLIASEGHFYPSNQYNLLIGFTQLTSPLASSLMQHYHTPILLCPLCTVVLFPLGLPVFFSHWYCHEFLFISFSLSTQIYSSCPMIVLFLLYFISLSNEASYYDVLGFQRMLLLRKFSLQPNLRIDRIQPL